MFRTIFPFLILVFLIGSILIYRQFGNFSLPTNFPFSSDIVPSQDNEALTDSFADRNITITDDVRHSIPLQEILSGGPGKDGIPSIDSPVFVSASEARKFVKDADIGLGIVIRGKARFYPYSILVWHEIVNDIIEGQPVLVTYCPLCATGIVFDPTINGEPASFGVSGLLWKSNLLMYNRTNNPDSESLWSQVLGEAVVGTHTGTRLPVIQSDTIQFGEWIKHNPETQVLSRDTGAKRTYGFDPYGDYYTDENVSFGATFSDERLHPKAIVLGIEHDGLFRAYEKNTIQDGETTDTFAGNPVTIKRTGDVVRILIDNEPTPYIEGFWFSWLAVHPTTTLFN